MVVHQAHPLVVKSALALERMAFVIAEPSIAPAAAVFEATEYFASVTIRGQGEGFVLVAASGGFTQEVAAGMLGVEPADIDPHEQGDATMQEMANVLGGHAIHEGAGDDSPLQIGLPQSLDRKAAAPLLERAVRDGFTGVLQGERGVLLIAGVLPH